MEYKNLHRAKFISRPNRFIAVVEIDGREETVHVKNTGRCKELLVKGATVFLEKSNNPLRKTAYDLVSVIKESCGKQIYINMDSFAPNLMAAEWLPVSGLFPEGTRFRSEIRCGASRFDFAAEYGDKVHYIEVKGVTLEKDGVAYFPDAPTERGVKHLNELAALALEGVGATVLFVVQMKGVSTFRPNVQTHPAFAEGLKRAVAAGVRVVAVDCVCAEGSARIDTPITVEI